MIILITGSSRGIGEYLSQELAGLGNKIIGFSRTSGEFKHENFEHFSVDVTDENEIKQALKEVRKKYGYVDILINNAGIASMNHFILTPTETAKRVMDINYFGTFNMCREVCKLMRKSENARIINFTTVAVPLNLAGEAAYASSKSAVESLTKILAKELSSYKITVNAIGPVPIKTALIAGVPNDKLDELLKQQAIKRFGEKRDVFNVVEFFIKPESDFITGQIIYLGGIS
ncbi:MAG: SDR family NAD(P)-dependent oxidoreductase [Cetobacterium sp.]